MKKKFNVTGLCVPEKHYMVILDKCLDEIHRLIDDGAYFTINRARQYGKTTTLNMLSKMLSKDYLIINLDFQALDTAKSADSNTFSLAFAEYFLNEMYSVGQQYTGKLNELQMALETIIKERDKSFTLYELFKYLSAICENAPMPVVLIIDETDSAEYIYTLILSLCL